MTTVYETEDFIEIRFETNVDCCHHDIDDNHTVEVIRAEDDDRIIGYFIWK